MEGKFPVAVLMKADLCVPFSSGTPLFQLKGFFQSWLTAPVHTVSWLLVGFARLATSTLLSA